MVAINKAHTVYMVNPGYIIGDVLPDNRAGFAVTSTI